MTNAAAEAQPLPRMRSFAFQQHAAREESEEAEEANRVSSEARAASAPGTRATQQPPLPPPQPTRWLITAASKGRAASSADHGRGRMTGASEAVSSTLLPTPAPSGIVPAQPSAASGPSRRSIPSAPSPTNVLSRWLVPQSLIPSHLRLSSAAAPSPILSTSAALSGIEELLIPSDLGLGRRRRKIDDMGSGRQQHQTDQQRRNQDGNQGQRRQDRNQSRAAVDAAGPSGTSKGHTTSPQQQRSRIGSSTAPPVSPTPLHSAASTPTAARSAAAAAAHAADMAAQRRRLPAYNMRDEVVRVTRESQVRWGRRHPWDCSRGHVSRGIADSARLPPYVCLYLMPPTSSAFSGVCHLGRDRLRQDHSGPAVHPRCR